MEKDYVKFMQNSFASYAISLTVEELVERTTVEYYDSVTGKGYQRPLVPSHYRKIAKYLQLSKNPVLPTAILTAVDPEQIIEGSTISIKGDLRVVDGQHRIEGIKYLKKLDEQAFRNISSFDFPVLVMIVPPEQKVHEINAFININKTSKPVSTDLAVQLKDKIRGENIDLILGDLNTAIATKVSQRLNKQKDSIWYELIKVGDEKTKGRTISINAFHQSLRNIIDTYLSFNEIDIINLDDFNDIVEDISYIVSRAWELIQKKWPECFIYEVQPNKYNIQKGIGVYSLHEVLSENLKQCKGNSDRTLLKFKEVLVISQVQSSDWKVGGKFSPYNSKNGFNQIAKYVNNEIVNIDNE